ncbi:MAG: DUF2786 domain-containing protein [Gammaproteobacteria bacterium]|nr:DUF2786 domain-containing protein [Gammaproteobacteria bacterium]
MDQQKIIDKISKCLRLSESCNPNEAAAALRQARLLMDKHNISEMDIRAAHMDESSAEQGLHFNPPFWALALSDIVAKCFDCRVLIARRYGKQPEYRFIGLDCAPSIASYTFTVLYRKLDQARSTFTPEQETRDEAENNRRKDVFAQAWLFRVASKVKEFVADEIVRKAVDEYVRDVYGNTEALIQDPVETGNKDYKDILSGMRAAEEVELYHSMSSLFPQALLMKSVI